MRWRGLNLKADQLEQVKELGIQSLNVQTKPEGLAVTLNGNARRCCAGIGQMDNLVKLGLQGGVLTAITGADAESLDALEPDRQVCAAAGDDPAEHHGELPRITTPRDDSLRRGAGMAGASPFSFRRNGDFDSRHGNRIDRPAGHRTGGHRRRGALPCAGRYHARGRRCAAGDTVDGGGREPRKPSALADCCRIAQRLAPTWSSVLARCRPSCRWDGHRRRR